MFALPISMPRLKSINFYQNIPKIKLPPCLQRRLGVSPPGPQNIPHIANFWLRTWCFYCCMLFCVNQYCGSLVFMVFRKQLFLSPNLPTPDIDNSRYWTERFLTILSKPEVGKLRLVRRKANAFIRPAKILLNIISIHSCNIFTAVLYQQNMHIIGGALWAHSLYSF